MNTTIIDVLIDNIKTDQALLETADVKINEAREAKREITDRLKNYRNDLSVMLKYANEIQRKKIDNLGFEISESDKGTNVVAAVAFETILNAKDNQLTNEQLYNAYVSSCTEKKEQPVNYTSFNIKCRSLFNTQKLLRKKGSDPKSSREDIISLNGRQVKPAVKEDEATESSSEPKKQQKTENKKPEKADVKNTKTSEDTKKQKPDNQKKQS